MKIHACVLFALSAVTAGCSSNTPQTPSGPITVGKNVMVSASTKALYHNEVIIGADPTHPGRLIACAIAQALPLLESNADGEGFSGTAAYLSTDAGATWKQAVLHLHGSWDPSCTFDSNGRALFIAGTDGIHERATLSYTNSALQWQKPIMVTMDDRPYVTSGPNGIVFVTYIPTSYKVYSDAYRANKHVTGFLSAVRVLRGTQLGPQMQYRPSVGYFGLPHSLWPGKPAVLPDGTYLQAIEGFMEDYVKTNPHTEINSNANRLPPQANGELDVARLAPGARTVEVKKAFDIYNNGGTVPSLAADMQSRLFKGRAYLAWSDGRSGRNRVYVSRSLDGGKTWSDPRAIDDGRFAKGLLAGPDNWAPQIAVNNKGVVGVAWQDRRDTNNLDYYVRFSASLDGGESWLPSVRVSEKPNEPYGPRAGGFLSAYMQKEKRNGPDGFGLQLHNVPWISQGHTAGLVADARGNFHPLWIDNRTGWGEVWTSDVAVRGDVTKYGDASLDPFQDVSRLVGLDLSDARLDGASRVMLITFRVKNLSKHVLRDVCVRLDWAQSPIAELRALTSRTARAAATLRPGAKSKPVQIRLALSDEIPAISDSARTAKLADAHFRVFARRR